jgi:hypothetical protein
MNSTDLLSLFLKSCSVYTNEAYSESIRDMAQEEAFFLIKDLYNLVIFGGCLPLVSKPHDSGNANSFIVETEEELNCLRIIEIE